MCALEILHVDEALVVSNKPSGLLAVPGRGPQKQDCLSARVQRQFDDALIVHRLDMGTSGLMILARGLEMQRRLQRQFALGQVNKGYVAVVSGRPDVPAMQWQRIDAATRANRAGQRLAIRTCDRRFAGGIHLGQYERIDFRQHRGEIIELVSGAAVAMRLERDL